jgi:hypothetical protein
VFGSHSENPPYDGDGFDALSEAEIAVLGTRERWLYMRQMQTSLLQFTDDNPGLPALALDRVIAGYRGAQLLLTNPAIDTYCRYDFDRLVAFYNGDDHPDEWLLLDDSHPYLAAGIDPPVPPDAPVVTRVERLGTPPRRMLVGASLLASTLTAVVLVPVMYVFS